MAEQKKENKDRLPILSSSWTIGYTKDFFRSLRRHDIFGFSSSFSFDRVQDLALRSGVSIGRVGKNNPLSQQYNLEYLARVTKAAPLKSSARKDLLVKKLETVRYELSRIEDIIRSF